VSPHKTNASITGVKYCGYEIDTRGVPSLVIPLAKRERALAMVEHLLDSPVSRQFSRLGLAVVAGVLQSLVEGTPHRLGHTYLREFHSLVRPPGLGSGADPYYTRCTLTSTVRHVLEWWKVFLHDGHGRYVRGTKSATLIPNWGDGSGTGTGGTLGLQDKPLQMWKGKWSPLVFRFSSNWKELMTLKLTLEELLRQNADDSLTGTTIFYFTDSSTVYWIGQSGSSPHPPLHSLIEQIRFLEIRLACSLQVVHVPGLLMIDQGTDGLSRGIWMSPLQDLQSSALLTQAVFAPLAYEPQLVNFYVTAFNLSPTWRFQDWLQTWDARCMFGTMTVWFPPPEIARQCIQFSLDSWAESPCETCFLFFVPRTIPGFWWNMSRHLQELNTFLPSEFPLTYPPTLNIPIVVLYLPPFTRSLTDVTNRLDPSPITSQARWHMREADKMRRLPPSMLPH
jgi:hypothetical protein